MTTPETIIQLLPTAQETLGSFLATLLGGQALLKLDRPVAADPEAEQAQASSSLLIRATGAAAEGFTLALEAEWLPLLSQAMLGEELSAGDDGYENLLREVAAQGYGTLRKQLAATGVTLPEASFAVQPPGLSPGEAASARCWKVGFTLETNGRRLQGALLLPAAPSEAPQPAAPSAAAPAAFPDLGLEMLTGDGKEGNFNLLAEVELEITAELGRRRLPLADLLRLTSGSVIELEKLVDQTLEVYANGRLIAEGKAVVIGDQFGIRITRLASARQRANAFL